MYKYTYISLSVFVFVVFIFPLVLHAFNIKKYPLFHKIFWLLFDFVMFPRTFYLATKRVKQKLKSGEIYEAVQKELQEEEKSCEAVIKRKDV